MTRASAGRVIVVGSGAAGVSAALSAARTGAHVTLLERAAVLGGTTSYSAGWPWIPANPRAGEVGATDSEAEALTYAHSLDLGDWDWPRAETYVRVAHVVMRAIEDATTIRWRVLDFPDYQAERPGGKLRGRAMAPQLVTAGPELAARIRADPTGREFVADGEQATGVSADEVDRRRRDGVLARGRGLVAGLLMAALQHGVDVRANTRGRRLLVDRGAVVGVEADGEEFPGSVVLASGGFERDPALVKAFLRGPLLAPGGSPSNEGDGLRMAMSAGAALGNMSEAWWCPALGVPGEEVGGAPYYRMLFAEYTKPGSLIVDQLGRRFADESQNYNDMGRALLDFSPHFAYPRVPAWLVFDATFRVHYGLGMAFRGADPDPAYLVRADSVAKLAAQIGAPPKTLSDTVDRFNTLAECGVDDDFGRGTSAWGRYMGDSTASHPNLAPLRSAPYYAVRILPGCLATKGGPRTDPDGRVLRADGGGPIPGLFAAGNVAASAFGLAYPGGGSTIGPALTFGWRSGLAAGQGDVGD